MALKLIANYSKRLGLPGYSSHQFSVSVETEVVNPDEVAGESRRLYELLQSNVDEQIVHTGFVPPGNYGREQSEASGAGGPSAAARNCAWNCSEKQRDLILKLVEENQLDKNGIEALAQERFGKGVRALGKLEASGLIDELLESYSGRGRKSGRAGGSARRGPHPAPAGRNGGGQ